MTVEEGISLVSATCPRIGRLICEGIDLTALRWSFNGGSPFSTFTPDNELGNKTVPQGTNPAFISVELTSVTQSSDPIFGNFSSTLTVDLSQLKEQSVSNITCGDPGTSKTVPVNVTIIKPSVPDKPNITNVKATYESASIRMVTLEWMKIVSK